MYYVDNYDSDSDLSEDLHRDYECFPEDEDEKDFLRESRIAQAGQVSQRKPN